MLMSVAERLRVCSRTLMVVLIRSVWVDWLIEMGLISAGRLSLKSAATERDEPFGLRGSAGWRTTAGLWLTVRR
jgi:hypothetical protein